MSAKADDLYQNPPSIFVKILYTRDITQIKWTGVRINLLKIFLIERGSQIPNWCIFDIHWAFNASRKYTQIKNVLTQSQIGYKSWLWFSNSNFSFAAKSSSTACSAKRAMPATGLEPAKVWVEVKIAYLPRHAKRGGQVELFELQTNQYLISS